MPGGIITGGDFSQAEIFEQVDKDDPTTRTPITDDNYKTSAFKNAWITVTLDLDGGTLPDGAATKQVIRRGASLKSAAPTKDGKQFAYWEGVKDGHSYYFANDAISCPYTDTDVNLKAVWCDFLINYKPAVPSKIDGEVYPLRTTMLPQAFTIGEAKTLSACEITYMKKDKTSAYFLYCWNTREDGLGRNYDPALEFTATEPGSMTLYPRWKSAEVLTTQRYPVLYRKDKDSTSFVAKDVTGRDGLNYCTLLSPDDTDLNYTADRGKEFAGWLLSASDNWAGKKPPELPENKVLFQPGERVCITVWEHPYPYEEGNPSRSFQTIITAQWKNLPVTEITFDANGTGVTGTTGNGNKETYYQGETLPLPTNGFARTNYTFTGWNTKADGTGTGYADKANITIEGDALVGKNVTLYAQWKSNKPETPTPQPTISIPQTGDEFNQSLWLGLCMASVAAMAGLIVAKKSRFSRR